MQTSRDLRPDSPLPPLGASLRLLASLAGKGLLAAMLGLAVLELVLRLAGLPQGVGSVRAAYDLDDSTLGAYEAGGRIFIAWPPEIAFEAHFNSFGCRGDEPASLEPPPIIALGDSYTFGFGVKDDETWPAVLEALLREAGTPRAVLNFGSPRLTIEDQIRYLRRALPALRSDVVILFPKAHRDEADLDAQGRTPHQQTIDATRRRRQQSWLRPLVRSLALSEARFTSSHWRHQLLEEGRGAYPPLRRDRPAPGEPEDTSRYRRGVAEAKALAESHGATLVLVSLPERGSRDGVVTMRESWTRKIAEELGVPYVDLYTAFSGSANPNEFFLLPYDIHPSPLGQRVTAQAIHAVLLEHALTR